MPGGRTWVEVDLDVLEENLRRLRAEIAGGARMMAVLKADGYGHGAAAVARSAVATGADFLGVATVDEALEIAEMGLPVLVLGWCPPGQYRDALVRGIRLTVTSVAEGKAMAAVARAGGMTARVHVKVDTGMGRLGFPPGDETARAVAELAAGDGLSIEGVFTHFACADEADKAITRSQLEAFLYTVTLITGKVGSVIRHAANTAGLLDVPDSHLDMVRAGIGIYGLYPSEHVSRRAGLKPAMTWKARVALVKDVPRGTPLSYGHTYTAGEDQIVITLPVGYADGYSRSLGGRACALISGRRLPVAGRVCMDQCMAVAPTGLDVRVGDEVVLMGEQAGETVSAEELATLLGTINYEVVTAVGRRVTRVYVRGGRPVGLSRAVSREESL